MKLFQTFFLTLLFGVSAMAQIPGYMGKRLLIDAEIQAFPARITPTTTDNSANTGNISGLHSRYGLGVGYVLSRSALVQAHFYTFRTGMNTVFYAPLRNGFYDTHHTFNTLSGYTLDLAYSRSRPARGHLSPLGKHRAFHAYITFANGNNNFYENGQPVENQYFSSIDTKYSIFGLGYSVTYNHILNDQFVLGYGWRINVSSPQVRLFSSKLNDNGNIFDTTDYKAYNLEEFRKAMISKFFFYDLLQFKITFGLLK
ncbi:MAG: hypothetical protein RLZZ628_889 [Bacteroidota bacterium]|jgi:hypothetical protein